MNNSPDINALLNDAMNSIENGFENSLVSKDNNVNKDTGGDRWTGKVIDNDDPLKLGRVKILIFGYYDDLAESALPWAVPDMGYFGGTNGNFIIPEVGTILRGYFDQKDIQKPIFDSVAYTQLTVQDVTKNPLMFKMEDYPNKMVLLETDQGEYLTLNKKSGETIFHHRTGLTINIGSDGSLTIHTGEGFSGPGNLSINTTGNATINVGGDAKIEAKMNVDINSVGGDVNLGRNAAKQLCNNYTNCLFAGIPHYVGNTNVKC